MFGRQMLRIMAGVVRGYICHSTYRYFTGQHGPPVNFRRQVPETRLANPDMARREGGEARNGDETTAFVSLIRWARGLASSQRAPVGARFGWGNPELFEAGDGGPAEVH